MNLDDFLERLDGVRPAGGGFVAICPSHEDSEPSLSVTESDEAILLKCHAGCQNSQVVEAMGLQWSDLFYHTTNYSEPEAVYSYRDEKGNELFQTLRFPGKKFKQRHLTEEGWVWDLKNVRRVLYRLPEIMAAVAAGRTIYFCEGEKDAEALVARGYEATCNPMGAGKWRDEFAAYLVGANVIIVADRDAPGRNHADKVRQALVGLATAVYVVQAKRGKDAHDHLVTHGLSVQDFVQIKERHRRGVITAFEAAQAALERMELGEDDIPVYEPMKLPSPGHLGPLKFKQGRTYVLGGYQGDGKTSLALQVATGLCQAGISVGYFTLEMTETDLINRLVVQLTGLPLMAVEEPWRQDSMQRKIYEWAVGTIADWPMDIIFDTGMTAEKVYEQTRNGEYEFVVIDHVHRFAWGRDRHDLETQIADMTNLALEENIVVLILAQLRKFMRGKDMEIYPRPELQDFRETSKLGDDGAMVMAVWRVRQDGTRYDPTGISELLVLKNRYGGTGSYFLKFNGPQTIFYQEEHSFGIHDSQRPTVETGNGSSGQNWYEA